MQRRRQATRSDATKRNHARARMSHAVDQINVIKMVPADKWPLRQPTRDFNRALDNFAAAGGRGRSRTLAKRGRKSARGRDSPRSAAAVRGAMRWF